MTETPTSTIYETRSRLLARARALADGPSPTVEDLSNIEILLGQINGLTVLLGEQPRDPTEHPETQLRMLESGQRRTYNEPRRPEPGAWLGGRDDRASRPQGGIGLRYNQLFGPPPRSAHYRSFRDFMTDIHYSLSSPGAIASRAMVSGDIGYLVPDEYSAQLFDQTLESSVVLQRCRIEPMTSDTKHVAGFSNNGSAAPFGIGGGWASEGSTLSPQTLSYRALNLQAKKLACLIQLSNESISDGAEVDGQVQQAMTGALSWLLDKALLAGSGAGEPLGILASSATIQVDIENGQLANTLVYENLANMLGRLLPSSFANSVWIASPSTVPQLLTLGIAVGLGGTPVPVLTQNNSGFSLLTRPCIFTEKASTLGSLGDIVLADLSQYVCGLRQQIVLERSSHAGFESDISTYRAKIRADGMPLLAAPYTPANGPSLSSFVTLKAR